MLCNAVYVVCCTYLQSKLLAAAGASNPNPLTNGSNTFYTLLPDSDSVLSYFNTFATAGATSISVIKEHNLERCALTDVLSAANLTGIRVDSYDVYNYTPSIQEHIDYLNGVTSDTILVCSRQHLCEGIKVALVSGSVNYFPKGLAMSPCVSNFHPEFTITSVPWSYELNQTCEYTGWSSVDFFNKFNNRFRVFPTYHAASAFASALILLTAVESSQSLVSERVLNEISQNSYATFYGNCSFANKYHQCDMQPVVLQKVNVQLLLSGTYIYIQLYIYACIIKWDIIITTNVMICYPLVYVSVVQVLLVEKDGNISSLHELVEKESVIYPPDKATNEFIYPAMTLLERECWVKCEAGHCDQLGNCVCDELYHGTNCNILCNGAVVDGECLDVRTVYVGGLIVDSTLEEYISIMHLAVELINNKTDGFFDFTTRILFEFMLNKTGCDSEVAKTMVEGRRWTLPFACGLL